MGEQKCAFGVGYGFQWSAIWNPWFVIAEYALGSPSCYEILVSLDRTITMQRLRKIAQVLLFGSLLAGCQRQRVLQGEHPKELVGDWHLVFGSDCSNYGLVLDHLVLLSDGSFDQHVSAKDGRHFDWTGQHWSYFPKSSIELDQRRDFFKSQNSSTLVGVPETEVLLLDLRSPPQILLNPHSDCVYEKDR